MNAGEQKVVHAQDSRGAAAVLRRGVEHPSHRPQPGDAPSTVGDYLRRAKVAGLGWPLPESVDDTGLERRLFPVPPPSRTARPRPDWSEVHRELRRRSVTLSLLWQEHKETHPEGLGSEVRPGGAPGAPRRREAVRRLRRADGAGGRPRDRRDAAGKLPGSRRSQFEQATPRLVEAQVGVDRAARRARFAGRVEPRGFHQPDTFTLALPLQQREKAARRGFRRARANPPPTRSHRAQSVGRTGRVVESRSPHPNRHHTRLTPRSSA